MSPDSDVKFMLNLFTISRHRQLLLKYNLKSPLIIIVDVNKIRSQKSTDKSVVDKKPFTNDLDRIIRPSAD